ncbi:MAG TPA: GNAT family N-acetyltransferase [Verrucomicrobiae bacterium]|jgi:RimJ/RimL family protein N-acetyltransferase
MNPLLLDLPEQLVTERLLLRPPRAGDGAELNRAVRESRPALRPWMPWAQKPSTVETSEVFCREAGANFAARKDLALLLWLKDKPVLVGGSGLHRMDWTVPKFEIGYWIRTRFTGKGYATEAVRAITKFARQTLKARRLEIRMDTRNRPSWRLAERLGFVLEGILRRDARNPDGRLRDTRVYAKVF